MKAGTRQAQSGMKASRKAGMKTGMKASTRQAQSHKEGMELLEIIPTYRLIL